jgi:hypothetical protein
LRRRDRLFRLLGLLLFPVLVLLTVGHGVSLQTLADRRSRHYPSIHAGNSSGGFRFACRLKRRLRIRQNHLREA